MNLWPFAKKNDTSPTGHLPSKKMELPPGVKLASPTEADLPASATATAQAPAAPEMAAAPEMEIAARETTPEAPSLQDMDFFPAQETAAVIAPPPKDLPEFFEQNQLEMISTGAPTSETKDSLPTEPENTATENLSALPDEAFAPPDFGSSPFELTPPAETLFSAEVLPNDSTTKAALDSDFSLSPNANWSSSFDPTPTESDPTDLFLGPLPDSDAISTTETAANYDAMADFNPSESWANVENPVTLDEPESLTPAWPQSETTEAFKQTAESSFEQCAEPTPEATLHSDLNPDWLSPHAEITTNSSADDNSFYMYPTHEFEPGPDGINTSPFGFTAEFEPETLSLNTNPSATAEDSNVTRVGHYSAQAIYEDGYTEIPAPLNLPDEILAPANDTNQLEVGGLEAMGLDAMGMKAIGIEPMDSSEYLEDSLNDESFDLDSLLLGQTQPIEQSEPSPPMLSLSENTSLAEEEGFAYDFKAPEDAPYELPDSIDTDETKPDEPHSDHYFGDEAEGLKAVDNLESYDFGHYEDPDEPAEAFELSADPTPLANSLTYDQYYVASAEHDLGFGAKQLAEATETFSEADTGSDSDSVPIQAEAMEDRPESGYASFVLNEPQKPEVLFLAETTTPSPEATLEAVSKAIRKTTPLTETTNHNIPVQTPTPKSGKAKPYQPQAEAAPKQRVESLSEALDSFGEDILLNNNRFLSRSIDRLVDHYFAQKDQNNR